MKTLRLFIMALALLVAPGSALADSSRNYMLEFHVGQHQPDVDGQFQSATPYEDIYGNKSLLMFGIGFDYQFWQEFGSLALGASARYGWVDGSALDGEGNKTTDDVGFNMLPVTLSLVYRWDWAAIRYSIPLVPYFKAGLSGAFWWATNGKDEISNTRDAAGNARIGRGLTLGYHVGGGLQFLLDILSPGMAQEFDTESGVNNSYLFAELLYQSLNDFGSDSSIDLSDTAWTFGLAFEF